MQLYTVTMTTAHLISVFDAKGRKIAEKNEPVTVTIRDLPLSTARAYQTLNPDGNVQITPQYGVYNEPFERRAVRSVARRDHHSKKVKSAKPAVSTPRKDAALTGDMSAALNVR